RGDVDALPAGVLDEGAPAAADVQHPVAGLDAAGVDAVLELALHGGFERLVVAVEEGVGVAADAPVQPELEELGRDVVVAANALLVAAHLPEEDGAGVGGPQVSEEPVV